MNKLLYVLNKKNAKRNLKSQKYSGTKIYNYWY